MATPNGNNLQGHGLSQPQNFSETAINEASNQPGGPQNEDSGNQLTVQGTQDTNGVNTIPDQNGGGAEAVSLENDSTTQPSSNPNISAPSQQQVVPTGMPPTGIPPSAPPPIGQPPTQHQAQMPPQAVAQTAATQAMAALTAIANQATQQQQQQQQLQPSQLQTGNQQMQGGVPVDPNMANFFATLSSQQQNLFGGAAWAAQLGATGIIPMMLAPLQGGPNPIQHQLPHQSWYNPAMNGTAFAAGGAANLAAAYRPSGPPPAAGGQPNSSNTGDNRPPNNPLANQTEQANSSQQGPPLPQPVQGGGGVPSQHGNPRKFTIPLFLEYDRQVLTDFQCLLRQQIELFSAGPEDIQENVKGRIKPVRVGQLGIRCRHCAVRPPDSRARGAMYFAYNVEGVYQLAQNMGKKHLCDSCTEIPPGLKQRLCEMYRSKENNNRRAGGKAYWVESLSVLGVYKDKETGMLRIKTQSPRN